MVSYLLQTAEKMIPGKTEVYIVDGFERRLQNLQKESFTKSYSVISEEGCRMIKAVGTPNGSSGKYMLIVLLGIAVGLFVLFLIVGHFPQAWNMPVKVTDGNRYIVYRLGKYMMDFEQLLITGLLCVFILMTAFEQTTPSWLWIAYIAGLVGGSMIFLILIAVIGAKNA